MKSGVNSQKGGNSKGLLNNLIWKFAERMSAQAVTLVVSIVLARMLAPSDYGIISIVTIFITLANVLVSDGFGSALIQKKDADRLDFSSVLYFNIFFSAVLYVILFFAAPYIAAFYGEGYEILTPVLRVMGLRLIISAVDSVQQAYVAKNMIFKKFFVSTISATVISAIAGLYMAYAGFGVWALVGQYLTNTTVATLVLMISIRQKPILKFSFNRLKSLLGFGIGILGTKLIATTFNEIRALVIGKVYSSEDLAYYDRGERFPHLIAVNLDSSMGAVLFPKLAEKQDDIEEVKAGLRRSVRFCSYVICPIMLGMFAVAEPFVKVLLTEKWLPCVPILRMFCISYMFHSIQISNIQTIKAVGRSDILFKMEFIRYSASLIVLVCVMNISVEAIVIGNVVLSVLYTLFNGYPNTKLVGYKYKEQFADILSALIPSVIMLFSIIHIGNLPVSDILKLILQSVCGVIVYITISVITKNKEFLYFWGLVKKALF